jgi:hypothetical protein
MSGKEAVASDPSPRFRLNPYAFPAEIVELGHQGRFGVLGMSFHVRAYIRLKTRHARAGLVGKRLLAQNARLRRFTGRKKTRG